MTSSPFFGIVAARVGLAMQRPRTRYARCGDLNIAYQAFGEGPVDLLVALGWLTNIEFAWESPDFARFLGKLGRFARVVFFDKRGTGMSDRDVGVATLEQRSEDILAVLDAAGCEKAALLGISEGGAMASVFAATFPERVSHLILNGSRARYSWAANYPHGLKPDEVESEIKASTENWGQPFSLDTGAPSVAGDIAVAEWFAAFLRYSASPRAAEQLTRMNYQIDYRSVLPAIAVPTLVLNREGDIWCPMEHARYLAANIPGALLKIIPGRDHIPWYGDQDRLVTEIATFVTGEATLTHVDRALVTIAFIDIMGSTGQVVMLGDEKWRGILEQLDIEMARRISGFGGRVVKHTGDGYLLAFTGPTVAIQCAQAAIADFERQGLQCRIGIHTGECERRGEDLSGIAVHIAARIMQEATPGAIACSQTVKDLTVGSGLKFGEIGTRGLRGIAGDWFLYTPANT